MQIILDQNEIETAIRALVNEQVSVKDGHEITIDLKAGRGENGFSALIEIAPATVKTTKPLGIEEKTARAPRGQTNEVKTEKAEPQAAKEEKTPETAQEADSDAPSAASTEDSASDAAGQEGGNATEEQATEDETPPKGPGPSLFANLSKPRNQ